MGDKGSEREVARYVSDFLLSNRRRVCKFGPSRKERAAVRNTM